MGAIKTNCLISSPAYFWDGVKQLSGTLKLFNKELCFCFDDFRHSRLNLNIPLAEIEYVKVFLLFNIANHGLKVVSKGDKVDMFILEDSKVFCGAIQRQIEKLR